MEIGASTDPTSQPERVDLAMARLGLTPGDPVHADIFFTACATVARRHHVEVLPGDHCRAYLNSRDAPNERFVVPPHIEAGIAETLTYSG